LEGQQSGLMPKHADLKVCSTQTSTEHLQIDEKK